MAVVKFQGTSGLKFMLKKVVNKWSLVAKTSQPSPISTCTANSVWRCAKPATSRQDSESHFLTSKQPHVEGGRVIGDILEPAIVCLPTNAERSSSELWRGCWVFGLHLPRHPYESRIQGVRRELTVEESGGCSLVWQTSAFLTKLCRQISDDPSQSPLIQCINLLHISFNDFPAKDEAIILHCVSKKTSHH